VEGARFGLCHLVGGGSVCCIHILARSSATGEYALDRRSTACPLRPADIVNGIR
jgi:hypothetical protein